MSWSVSISGKKEQAKEAAESQSNANIANGYQTEAQKVAVLAMIDAAPGDSVSGSIGGHNNDGNVGGSMSANVTSWTAAPVAMGG